jgi:tetratricopeptide (TPR) repeat protein
VRRPLDIEDVEDLEFGARTPEERREVAARLVAWAEETHPQDGEEVTPANLLVHAAEQLSQAGDHDRALELFRRAVSAEGDVLPDVRCHLHHGLIAAGDVAGARRLAEEVRRSRPTDPDVYQLIGEDYEAAGDLAEANRWMNLGLRCLVGQAEEGDEALSGFAAVMLLAARRRVRRALGFPPDEFDDSPLLPPVAE